MTPLPHASFFLGPVRCSTCTISELLGNIQQTLASKPRRGLTINFINAHLFNLCREDQSLCNLINQSDIVAADGMAIVWASRLFGGRIPERCNMTDAFRSYLADKSSPPVTATLIGGNNSEVQAAAATIQKDGPQLQITRTLSGFLSVDDYVNELRGQTPTDMVLLGMGTPKSEQVAFRLREIWPESVIWHIGGGTIMFFAGSLVEAPIWMRKTGLQWLHRLLIEPGRMWRRYVIGNPLFIARILWSLIRKPAICDK